MSQTPAGVRVVGWDTWAGIAGSAAPLSVPSEPGDLAVILYSSQFGNTPATPPSGWTSQIATGSGGLERSGYVAYLVVDDRSDTLDVDVQGAGSAATSGARDGAVLVVFRGVTSATVTGWQPTIPTVTEGTVALVASQHHAGAATRTPDWGNWWSTILAGDRSADVSWSQLRASLMDSTPVVPEGWPTPQGWCSIALAPASPKTVEVQGDTVTDVQVWDGAELVDAVARSAPRNALTAQDILSGDAGSYIPAAHRGGSVSQPECSMRAYTDAVMRGVPLLEVPCHRTSDGVWFACHDSTLTRVDPTAPSTPVYEMTWEEVSQYTTKGEPFVRVLDLAALYGEHCVLVIDTKTSSANWQDLYNQLVSTGMDVPARTIWKMAGDATWLSQQWKAAGLVTMGYCYENQIEEPSMGPTWSQGWDLFGIPYECTAAHVTMAGSWGKPLWAHICPTRQSFLTPLAWGENKPVMVMLAGTDEVFKEVTV